MVSVDTKLSDLVASVKAQGLEVLVAKRSDHRYEPGMRSGAWQKMRVNQGQEFVIGGYTHGPRLSTLSCSESSRKHVDLRRAHHVGVQLATHEEGGGVFGAPLTTAALIARALRRFFAPVLARACTSLRRLRCADAFC